MKVMRAKKRRKLSAESKYKEYHSRDLHITRTKKKKYKEGIKLMRTMKIKENLHKINRNSMRKREYAKDEKKAYTDTFE